MPEAPALRRLLRWTPGRPRPLGPLLALLAAQAAFAWMMPREWQAEHSPGDPPTEAVARIAALGEARMAAYALTLYVQGFDMQAGQPLAIRSLNSAAIRAWLDRALDLNPDSGYPLLLASRIYAEAAHPDDAREMLRLVMRRFEQSPATRWPWMAHGLFVARHVLNDPALAVAIAGALRLHGDEPAIPAWARQAEIFLLADLDQPRAARALLTALLRSGAITDQAELTFLTDRLAELEARAAAAATPSPCPSVARSVDGDDRPCPSGPARR